ncbi:helix-turn-helix domain-containing protein [Dyella sp. C9]|uniref:AlbA family DNA-binding domain-containing protein n=1 Tax=Dyella sp. C9 TaxID=2202154 RepID=UPI000DEEE660|nr:hypothetical protein [Dyella sp. C9]
MRLELRDIDGASTLDAWFAIYEQNFPLLEERESRDGFAAVLRLNDEPSVQHAMGPWREFVLGIYHDDELVGGLVFGATASATHRSAGYGASVQIIYLFNQLSVRGHLRFGSVMAAMEARVRGHYRLGPTERIAYFFEANQPEEMTENQLSRDEQISGMGPYERYRKWLHLHARPLRFHYVQPALDPEAEACPYLDLFTLSLDHPEGMSSRMLQQHLHAFVSISVLKGRDAYRDNHFAAMTHELDECERVPYVAPADARLQRIEHRPVHAESMASLVNSPRETLHNEYKWWLRLHLLEDRAHLAKAVIGLANSGGGHVVLGYVDPRTQAGGDRHWVAAPRPPDCRGYNVDAINEIISTYASPAVHCDLDLVWSDRFGQEHPVITVPSGGSTPIVPCQAIVVHGRDGKPRTALSRGACYVRLPGPRTDAAVTADDWSIVLDRVVRERISQQLRHRR